MYIYIYNVLYVCKGSSLIFDSFPNLEVGLRRSSLCFVRIFRLGLHLRTILLEDDNWGMDTLPETNIAMENPPFWWYLPGKMGIFMGYVSFREGSPKNWCGRNPGENAQPEMKAVGLPPWKSMVGKMIHVLVWGMGYFQRLCYLFRECQDRYMFKIV